MNIHEKRIAVLKSLIGEQKTKDFAEKYDLDPSYISQILNGHRNLGERSARNLEEKMRLSNNELVNPQIDEDEGIDEILKKYPQLTTVATWDDRTPLDDDEIQVPFLKEVELSAGSGRYAIEESGSKAKLRFGKSTLRNKGVDPKNIVCVTVKGNSMTPILPDNSTVGVDTGATKIIDGDMYAVALDNEILKVKQLYRLSNGVIRLRSFNRDEFEDEEYEIERLRIIGRIFWSSVLW